MQPHHLASDPYEQALYAITRLPAHKIMLGLPRVQAALRRLNHPERQLRGIIHVAGTNGKGSTVAFMRAILQAHGVATASSTSPHLVSFGERLLLPNNTPMPLTLFTQALAHIKRRASGLGLTPFECATVAMFLIMARTPHDAFVLETGLGGLLDATNVVRPALCMITPIDFDHVDILGHTLTQIATQKAGIIKPNTPVVSAPQHPHALAVLQQHSAQKNAPFMVAPLLQPRPVLALAGDHQQQNAAVAYAGAQRFLGRAFCASKALHGLATAQHNARLQHITWHNRAVLLDGAHNVHGATACAAYVRTLAHPITHIVFCCGKNRDAAALWQPFAALNLPFVRIALQTPPDASLRANMQGDVVLPSLAHLPHYIQTLPAQAHVLITGSLYLCGAALNILQ